MKRIIKIFIISAILLMLTSFISHGASAEGSEYLVSTDGEEYILSVYEAGVGSPIIKSKIFKDISAELAKLSEGSRLVFAGRHLRRMGLPPPLQLRRGLEQ